MGQEGNSRTPRAVDVASKAKDAIVLANKDFFAGALTRGVQVGDCFLASRSSDDGYGSIWFRDKGFRASRCALLLHTGEAADGRWALHTCRQKACISVAHLYWGTPKQNVDDRNKRDFPDHDFQVRGVDQPRAKATDAKAKDAWESYWHKGEIVASLCARLRLPRSVISNILKRKTWQHVTYNLATGPGPSVRKQAAAYNPSQKLQASALRGENAYMAKLTAKDVVAIWLARRQEKPTPTYAELGDRYGVKKETVASLLHRRSWVKETENLPGAQQVTAKASTFGNTRKLKLSDDDVRSVWRKYHQEGVAVADLCSLYSCSDTYLYQILTKKIRMGVVRDLVASPGYVPGASRRRIRGEASVFVPKKRRGKLAQCPTTLTPPAPI